MGQSNWTNEQHDAITDQGCNLLVAAAAGSGKTAVLVERIIRRITNIENPVDIDKLLVVTFTNAAAAEMRERLAAAIANKISENPADKNLHKQLTLLNKASITTIHSFCLDVIRNNYTATDLDPAFSIIDDAESKMLREEALESILAKRYEKGEAEDYFITLLEGFGHGRDDRMLQDKILQVYEFTQSFPWPEDWMHMILLQYKQAAEVSGFEELIWGKALISYAKTIAAAAIDTAKHIKGLVDGIEGFGGYSDTADEDISVLNHISQKLNGTWNEAYEAVKFSSVGRLKSCSKGADESIKEEFKMGRDVVKSTIKKLSEDIFVAVSDIILNEIIVMTPVIGVLFELVNDFSIEYTAMKAEKNGVDFNDLEHFALKVLTDKTGEDYEMSPSRIAMNYRDKFVEVLVDEYQDSNLIQEEILTKVSRQGMDNPNMFMVGDIKQSIYKFRLAMPEIFLNKYKRYSGDKGGNDRKIQLFKNFRSRDDIINGVNFIFKQIMSEEAGELDYNDNEALSAGFDYPACDNELEYCGGKNEIIIIDTYIPKDEEDEEGKTSDLREAADNSALYDGGREKDDQDEENPDKITAEARAIGNRINKLTALDENGKAFVVYDKDMKIYRPVKFRDIVILMRSPGDRAEIFTQELANMGIPIYADVGEAFFKSAETMTVLSLLQVLDNPLCDIPLLSVLLSPIGGFTAEELALIRKDSKRTDFYTAVKTRANLKNEQAEAMETKLYELSEKCTCFIDKIERWRRISSYTPIDNLIWQIYNETSYYAIVGAYPGGKLRQANLKMLFEKAGQYEKSTYKGLFNFMNYMEKVRTGKFDVGSAKILGENEDVVRIMSIHKSKGLEFPVVFLAGCGNKINMSDLTQEVMLHRELGIGCDFVDVEKRIRYSTPVKEAIKFNIKAETISEEMRILYTGLTRAREKLIITGTANNVPRRSLKWRKNLIRSDVKLQPYFMLESGTYFDFICSSIMRHPDGKCLSDFLCFENLTQIKDPSRWDINIIYINQLVCGNKDSKVVGDHETKAISESQREELFRRLNYIYPYQERPLPAKITVTELKRRYAELDDEYAFRPAALKKPRFMEGKRGFSASEKGTIIHFVMQHIDMLSIKTAEDIEENIRTMIDQSLLTGEEAEIVDSRMISGFINSEIGERIVASGKVYREIPFSISLDAGELMDSERYNECKVLLQGIIDCYFIENDEIVILDYKTDYIEPGNEGAIKERYSLQLKCYAKALEIITGKRVKSTYIYLMTNGSLVRF